MSGSSVEPVGTARVGFIGLGNIGKPMALTLARSEAVDLVVYDVMPGPVDELVAAGAKSASSVAELAAAVDVVCVMVRDDDQVRDVLGEILAVPGDARTVVIHSTIAPGTPGELEDTAAKHGVKVVDAPVSGGAMGAADGSLAIMVGGTDEAFAAAKPALEVLGSVVVHAGAIGSGTKMKLARNMMHFTAFTAVTEAQRLAEAAGIDLVALGNVVRHTDRITGGPGAIMYRDTTARLDPSDFWFGVFSNVTSLGEKDLGFAVELADQLGVDVPLAKLSLDRLGTGLGLPAKDPAMTDGKFDHLPPTRKLGLERMEQVYGFEMTDGVGDFFGYTADHLFADIWERPGLTDRDRRLLLIGLLAGSGGHDVFGIQIPAAYANGEFDDVQLREMVIFLCHYAGWPNGARLNSVVENTIAQAAKAKAKAEKAAAAEAAGAEDPGES